jgi:hypothetical protein
MSSLWKRSEWSFLGVLVGNLAALSMIWWFDWQVHALLLAYWLEAGVVGAIYVAKIHRAEGVDDPDSIRSFWKVDGEPPRSYVGRRNGDIASALVDQYLFIWLIFGGVTVGGPFIEDFFFSAIEPARPLVVASVAVSLVATHVFSYWHEYLGNREFERRGPVSLLVEPGTRFLALFGAVFVGGAAVGLTRNPFAVAIVLTFFKTCADLFQHGRERERAVAGLET